LWVQLRPRGGYNWTTPQSSDQRVLPRIGTGCPYTTPTSTSGGSPCAVFRGGAAGQADVTATANPACYPQCLAPSYLFRITVIVS